MTLTELIALFRIHTQDIEYPGDGDSSDSLFKNDEIIEYFNESQQEFCRRTEILFESRDSDYTSYKIKANDPWVDVDPSIIGIKRARTSNGILDLKVQRDFDDTSTNLDWEDNTGVPIVAITDMQLDTLRLYPIPLVADTLSLRVTRLPVTVTSGSDEPEIPIKFHRKLIHYALFLAYSKQDADSFDPNKAQAEYSLAEQVFDDGRKEVGIRYKKVGTTTYGGI